MPITLYAIGLGNVGTTILAQFDGGIGIKGSGAKLQAIDMHLSDLPQIERKVGSASSRITFVQLSADEAYFRQDRLRKNTFETPNLAYPPLRRYWDQLTSIIQSLGVGKGVSRYRPLARYYLGVTSDRLVGGVNSAVQEVSRDRPGRLGVFFVLNGGGGFGSGSFLDVSSVVMNALSTSGIPFEYHLVLNLPAGEGNAVTYSKADMPLGDLRDLRAAAAASLVDLLWLSYLTKLNGKYKDRVTENVRNSLHIEDYGLAAVWDGTSESYLILTTYHGPTGSLETKYSYHDVSMAIMLALAKEEFSRTSTGVDMRPHLMKDNGEAMRAGIIRQNLSALLTEYLGRKGWSRTDPDLPNLTSVLAQPVIIPTISAWVGRIPGEKLDAIRRSNEQVKLIQSRLESERPRISDIGKRKSELSSSVDSVNKLKAELSALKEQCSDPSREAICEGMLSATAKLTVDPLRNWISSLSELAGDLAAQRAALLQECKTYVDSGERGEVCLNQLTQLGNVLEQSTTFMTILRGRVIPISDDEVNSMLRDAVPAEGNAPEEVKSKYVSLLVLNKLLLDLGNPKSGALGKLNSEMNNLAEMLSRVRSAADSHKGPLNLWGRLHKRILNEAGDTLQDITQAMKEINKQELFGEAGSFNKWLKSIGEVQSKVFSTLDQRLGTVMNSLGKSEEEYTSVRTTISDLESKLEQATEESRRAVSEGLSELLRDLYTLDMSGLHDDLRRELETYLQDPGNLQALMEQATSGGLGIGDVFEVMRQRKGDDYRQFLNSLAQGMADGVVRKAFATVDEGAVRHYLARLGEDKDINGYYYRPEGFYLVHSRDNLQLARQLRPMLAAKAGVKEESVSLVQVDSSNSLLALVGFYVVPLLLVEEVREQLMPAFFEKVNRVVTGDSPNSRNYVTEERGKLYLSLVQTPSAYDDNTLKKFLKAMRLVLEIQDPQETAPQVAAPQATNVQPQDDSNTSLPVKPTTVNTQEGR